MRKNSRSLSAILFLALAIPVSAQENTNNDNIGALVSDTNSGIPEHMTNERLEQIIVAQDVTQEAGNIPFVPGDVTRDGVVNVADVVTLLRGTVGLDWQPDTYYFLGDIAPNQAPGDDTQTNVRYAVGNGVVDVGDVVAALRASVGIIQLRFPQRAIYIEANYDNEFPLMVQGFTAKFFGPYNLLEQPVVMSVTPAVLNPQETSYIATETNDFYQAIGFVGTTEARIMAGGAIVKMSWIGPAIGFGGPGGYQIIDTSDAYGNVTHGYRCDQYPAFQFRYMTQVPGFLPEGSVYSCVGRG